MQTNNSVNFKSHLTPSIKKMIKTSDVRFIEKSFKENYGVETDFLNNKTMASFFAFTLNIFEELNEKYNLPFSALPTNIRVYNEENLISRKMGGNFCISDSGLVLKRHKPFPLRSIFMMNLNNAKEIDKEIEKQFLRRQRSSSHFLSEVIHEWSHNIHLDLIYKKFGYNGKCPFAKSLYPVSKEKIYNDIFINNNEQNIQNEIYNTLGAYAQQSNSKKEIFAECLAQIITNSIDCNSLKILKNPLDNLTRMPKTIRTFLEKELFG